MSLPLGETTGRPLLTGVGVGEAACGAMGPVVGTLAPKMAITEAAQQAMISVREDLAASAQVMTFGLYQTKTAHPLRGHFLYGRFLRSR